MLDIKENINCFTYWEGKEIPYLELCFETMNKHCPQVIRLNEKTCQGYVDLPKEYFKIKAINHRVDYLKAKLIYQYGGFWLDADTILLKELPFKMIEEIDYFGCPGLFGGQKGSKTIKKWLDHMDRLIREKSEFAWAELIMPVISHNWKKYEIKNIEEWRQYNQDINLYWQNGMIVEIDDYMAQEGLKYGAISEKEMCENKNVCLFEIINMDLKMIHPWWGTNNLDYLKKEAKTEIPNKTFATILYNKVFTDEFKKMSREQVLSSGTRLANLLNISLYA